MSVNKYALKDITSIPRLREVLDLQKRIDEAMESVESDAMSNEDWRQYNRLTDAAGTVSLLYERVKDYPDPGNPNFEARNEKRMKEILGRKASYLKDLSAAIEETPEADEEFMSGILARLAKYKKDPSTAT
ncbi:hypothetical protein DFP72DRAFT_1065370 [Ephemerocybe angulata]|uniref:Uncharacterized protein n=1 Tax=Ephemerocybe angulata TaxID=980116 RepID=A0A8H6M6Z4_9AGAR|nr:hypothetical protein DFP72DRAFT_1065370 [Tulosesus angulatus]